MSKFSIEENTLRINKELEAFDFGNEPNNLYDPIYYFIGLGGKRIRPLLTLFGAYLFTDNYTVALKPALSTEIFHNFSLIHDDIMDKAPLRRGKQTVHKKWNDNIAILSGDAMFVKAYQALGYVDAEFLPKALKLYNRCALEVCEGQQLDMDFEDVDVVTEEAYLEMIRLKTAVLLGFSLRLGALLGGASKKDRDLIEKFGTSIGIGFQLKDDLLDVYGDQAKVGKQIAGDILCNKKTFLLINALRLANESQAKVLSEWLNKENYNEREKIDAIVKVYDELGIAELTTNKMNEYFDQGFHFLEQIECSEERKTELNDFARWLINRDR